MHYCTLVLGPDPLDQIDQCGPSFVDWRAIGGRYTGNLILRPGATSGRVYGDAISSGEAHLTALMPEDSNTVMVRGTKHGPGVDQAIAGEIDWEQTEVRSPAILVDHGQWHEPPDEAQTSGMVASMVAAALRQGMEPDSEWARETCRRSGFDNLEELFQAAEEQMAGWNKLCADRIAQTSPGTLVTVVDVHQ